MPSVTEVTAPPTSWARSIFKGEVEERSAVKAAEYLTQSAEGGNQYAQYLLGKLYLLGKDIPQDREAAVRWFTLAAKQGKSQEEDQQWEH